MIDIQCSNGLLWAYKKPYVGGLSLRHKSSPPFRGLFLCLKESRAIKYQSERQAFGEAGRGEKEDR